MTPALYVETSALLRSFLEPRRAPSFPAAISAAEYVVTSRLSLVEAGRALLRIRRLGELPETRLSDAETEIERFFARCELSEITPAVCDLAARVAPQKNLRTLDAVHLATFLLARRKVESLELLTADRRLQEAAETA